MSENSYRFHLLEKKATGYFFVGVKNVEVQDSATASVEVIENAARTAINQRRRLPHGTDIRLDVYQPPQQFGDHGMKLPDLRRTLQDLFNDDYRDTCSHLWADDGLEEIEFKEHLIVVFVVAPVTIEFFLFNHTTNAYFGRGEVTAVADQTVWVVKDAARKFIMERTPSNVAVRINEVMEPRESISEECKRDSCQLEEYNREINIDSKNVILHETNTSIQRIRSKDSLIINFGITELQYLVLFERVGPSYTCLGSYKPSALPNMDGTIDMIIQQVKMDIPELGQREILGAYEFLGKHKDLEGKTIKQIQTEIPLDDDYLRGNTNCCILQSSLRTVESNILIIIFENQGYENRKRSLGTIEEETPHITRKMIAEAARGRGPPSEDAKPTTLYSTQTRGGIDAVRNERPMHLAGPPIQIYHPVFVKFLSRAFEPFDGDKETLQQTSALIEASRQCYKNEEDRMKALRPCLANLVHEHAFAETTHYIDDGSKLVPDATIYAGCKCGSTRLVCAFVEVKIEVGATSCDPALQCQSDFVKLCSASDYWPIIDASCCPVFLLAIAGPHLLVAGAVFADTFIAQELTNYISLGSHPTDPDRGLRRVAQVLVTLRECIQELDDFYRGLEFIEAPPTNTPAPSRGSKKQTSRSVDPTPRYLPKYPLEHRVFPCHEEFKLDNQIFSLTYKGRLAHGVKTTRALFTASMKSPNETERPVVVKFTRRYCPEAHRLLAEMSLAPRLIYNGFLAGIHFVVMEHFEGAEVTSDALEGAKGAGHIESLRKAIQVLHNKGFVFGDLREPNILIGKDGMKLVDFDWSGKSGEVHYPIDISRDIRWPEGVGGEGTIEVEHDKEWFRWITGTEL